MSAKRQVRTGQPKALRHAVKAHMPDELQGVIVADGQTGEVDPTSGATAVRGFWTVRCKAPKEYAHLEWHFLTGREFSVLTTPKIGQEVTLRYVRGPSSGLWYASPRKA